jgi:hypothetical protein
MKIQIHTLFKQQFGKWRNCTRNVKFGGTMAVLHRQWLKAFICTGRYSITGVSDDNTIKGICKI